MWLLQEKSHYPIPWPHHLFFGIPVLWSSRHCIYTARHCPSVCCSRDVSFDDAVSMYEQDLPSPELFPMELRRWKNKYMAVPASQRPTTPAKSIKDCDQDLFPNIYIFLQIACTIPVTSCECERSASALCRLNTYMRASMGKTRLSYLALLHIHYDMQVDLDEVVDRYAQLHPHRMELESLIAP